MTTTATIPGAELRECGQPDNLETKVIGQLRHMRDTYRDKKRPYVLTMYIDGDNVFIFAGHPAGKVKE